MTKAEATKHSLFSDWIVAAKEAKKPIEWEWLVRKNFLDGNHWIKWDKTTSSLVNVGGEDKFKVTINKVYSIARAVRAYVTKHHPKWEIMSMDTEKRVYEKAVASERFLDMYYLEEKIKPKLKNTVYDALYASVGHWWFWWDSENEWLHTENVDPFDFLPDPTAKDTNEYSDAKFVFRAMSKKTEDIKADERFKNRDEVLPDGLLAASDIKTALIQMTAGVNQNAWTDTKDLSTTITYEGYYIADDKSVRHVLMTANTILIDEPTTFESLPARTYHTDTETGKQYTQGWIKNVIPSNKLIDTLESQSLEFNHVIAKGRYVTDKNSGVNIIVNKNGQIIEKNRGSYFEQLGMQSQPSSVEAQIVRASRYIEDIGASHDAFIGRMPTGANSGVAIETLLYGEENNLTDLRDNLDDFYVSVAKFILKVYKKNRINPIMLFAEVPEQDEPEFSAVVGDESPVKLKETNVLYNGKEKKVKIERIKDENNIRVTVGTWLGTGKLDSRSELLKLYQAGLIDQQTVLQYFNAPNIPRIIERTAREQTNKALMQAAVSQPPGTMPAVDAMPMAGSISGTPTPAPAGAEVPTISAQ